MGLKKPDKTVTGGGIVLPELTNPATANEILSGYEALDGNGVLLTGTLSNGLAVLFKDYTVNFDETKQYSLGDVTFTALSDLGDIPVSLQDGDILFGKYSDGFMFVAIVFTHNNILHYKTLAGACRPEDNTNYYTSMTFSAYRPE